MFSPSVDNLVAQLTHLPGVGQRTAQRLAFHLLRVPKDEAGALAAAIAEVKERVRFCRECGNFTEEETCEICRDARRDHSIVCVVEQPADLISVERTHEYRGLYHVLGGALSPLDGVEPEHLRIDELLGRVERNGIEERTAQQNRRFAALRLDNQIHSFNQLATSLRSAPGRKQVILLSGGFDASLAIGRGGRSITERTTRPIAVPVPPAAS
jgi:recombination protein RecR